MQPYYIIFGVAISRGLMAFIIVLLLVLAILPAWMAAKKGRSAVLWYIYGVALWLVAALHAALLVNNTLPMTPEERAAAKRKGKKTALAILGVFLLVVALLLSWAASVDARRANERRAEQYAAAEQHYAQGDYERAYNSFVALESYEDASARAREVKALWEAGQAEELLRQAEEAKSMATALALLEEADMDDPRAQAILAKIEPYRAYIDTWTTGEKTVYTDVELKGDRVRIDVYTDTTGRAGNNGYLRDGYLVELIGSNRLIFNGDTLYWVGREACDRMDEARWEREEAYWESLYTGETEWADEAWEMPDWDSMTWMELLDWEDFVTWDNVTAYTRNPA